MLRAVFHDLEILLCGKFADGVCRWGSLNSRAGLEVWDIRGLATFVFTNSTQSFLAKTWICWLLGHWMLVHITVFDDT